MFFPCAHVNRLFEHRKNHIHTSMARSLQGPIYDLTFSDCGRILASASKDCTVRLWTPDVRGDSHVLKAHTKGVRSVCISKDSSLLLTASDDKTVKMWSTHQRKFKCSFTGHKHWVRSAHLSPDCRSGEYVNFFTAWKCRGLKRAKG